MYTNQITYLFPERGVYKLLEILQYTKIHTCGAHLHSPQRTHPSTLPWGGLVIPPQLLSALHRTLHCE